MDADEDGALHSESSKVTAEAPGAPARPRNMRERCGAHLAVWRKALWGDLSAHEYQKIAFLALIFLLIVGSYWLLRTQKDALFMKITGKLSIPYAKMGTFAVMFPIILLYGKLVDHMGRVTLFYVVCGTYGLLFGAISIALEVPGLGLDNTVPSSNRILGWVIYIGIETFASVVVPMFWSFTNSIMDNTAAKSGFGLIVWGAQFGSIGGPSLCRYSGSLGIINLVRIGALAILAIVPVMWAFARTYPQVHGGSLAYQRTGVLEGIRLLLRHHYLMGIFGITTFCEVIVTILDYQMKFELDNAFSNPADIAHFMGSFGQWTNGVTLVFSFLGTGFFINRYGLTSCLLAFPITVACVILLASSSSVTPLNVLFWAMVVIKGLTYGLNVPCKEILYIPTTADMKYKTKSWIDMFGSRGAKSLASVINSRLRTPEAFAMFSAPINLTIVAVWLVVAARTGDANRRLVANNVKLGDEEEEGDGREKL